MRTVRKIAVLLLAICLLAGGCSGGDTRWVYQYGEYQVPAGLYILYQLDALQSAGQKLQQEHADEEGYELPAQKELLKEGLEGKSVSDWINEQAAQSARKWLAVAKEFDARGLVLAEADKSVIDSNADSVWAQQSKGLEPNGISIESVREYYANEVRKTYLFDDLYEEGGELAVSEDELRGIFEKDFAKIEFMTLSRPSSVPDGETKTLEQLDADVKAEAEAYLKRLEEGEAIEELAYEYSVSLAGEGEKDSVTKLEKSDLELMITEAYRSSYGDAIVDGAMGAAIGIPTIVEETSYYAVIKRVDASPDFEEYSYTILYNLKNEEFEGKTAEWAAVVEPLRNSAAISRYQPSKLKATEA